ncbi:MAG TPA: serine-type D-Ala-D-Ala carboxypeptidase, partial [Candidatus Competibacteraceae bacterium]|nr:serine-type D-Ala-D-Ala carboxypeptidase [Candidatus Competibacteraceae bacterium]
MLYLTARRILLFPLLLALLWLNAGGVALAQTAALAVPPPPQVPVRGYVLMDYQSGNLLANAKGDERMEPASITKLMTGYVIYRALQS